MTQRAVHLQRKRREAVSVPKIPQIPFASSVISLMAIRSILEKDKYVQFLCLPLNYHSVDLHKLTIW